MSINESNSFNDNSQSIFEKDEELINESNSTLNVTLLIISQEKLVNSFKDLFRKYRMDNTISEKYTKKEIRTNISFTLNNNDYSQLDEIIHLILLEEQNIYDVNINDEKMPLFIHFTNLYLSILNDNNYIVYKVTNNTSNYKTEYILKKEGNKYVIKEDYYSLYRGEYLYSDSGEFKEISKNEAMKLIFYNLDEVSIHHK